MTGSGWFSAITPPQLEPEFRFIVATQMVDLAYEFVQRIGVHHSICMRIRLERAAE